MPLSQLAYSRQDCKAETCPSSISAHCWFTLIYFIFHLSCILERHNLFSFLFFLWAKTAVGLGFFVKRPLFRGRVFIPVVDFGCLVFLVATDMEEEQQDLRDLVIELRAQNEQLRRASSPGPASGFPGSAGTSGAAAERLLYIPRERKCPMFSGNGGITIVDWIEEVRASMRARHLAPIDQAYFIYDHLGGSAKDEIKYRPKQDREDPEKVLAILQEVYGCPLSYVALQKDFFSRKQLEGESLQEYSHALFDLMEKIMRNAPQTVSNSAILLRDQFVEHVNDSDLRRALKQVVRAKPTANLLDVRSEAIRWEREGREPEGRPRSFSVPSICATHTVKMSDQITAPPPIDMTEIKEMLKKQQEQIDKLSAHLLQLHNPPRWSQPPNNGRVICRRCQQPGHFARNCNNERAPSQQVHSQPYPTPSSAVQNQQPEN